MKTRESGMPEEEMWREFFDPEAILRLLRLTSSCRDVVDFGCGYGTFAIPAARIVRGIVHALDVEPGMATATQAKADTEGLRNVRTYLRDFVAQGTGLPSASMDYAMLFNILHCESPDVLLGEAFRVLSPGGILGIIHWNYDPATPRGPAMEIRPRPEQCREWAVGQGFRLLEPGIIEFPPYHYGMALERT
jgi:ubiquinone/menaquinone biosynthesis C-methylase UbiE